jgi:maltose O-acetyltransferase
MKIIKRIFADFILMFMPYMRFPKVNAILFRMKGYNIDSSAKIFSTVQILGNIIVNIDKNTFIGHETLIMGGNSKITIGKNCDISSRVNIVSGTHQIDMNKERSAGCGTGKDIKIEDGVWVGFGVLVLPGVTIGKKSIIGAGSVVTKDIPPYCIAVGNPCKPIKKWNSESYTFEPIV